MSFRDMRQAAQNFVIGTLVVVGFHLIYLSLTGRKRGGPGYLAIVGIVAAQGWARARYATHGAPAPASVRILGGLVIAGLTTALAYVAQPLFLFPFDLWDFVFVSGTALLASWILLGQQWPDKDGRVVREPSGP